MSEAPTDALSNPAGSAGDVTDTQRETNVSHISLAMQISMERSQLLRLFCELE